MRPALLSAYAGLYVSTLHSYPSYGGGVLPLFAAPENWAKQLNWNFDPFSSSLIPTPSSPAWADETGSTLAESLKLHKQKQIYACSSPRSASHLLP